MIHFSNDEVGRYIDTIWSIAASRFCKTFLIGYTAKHRYERFASYRSFGWEHLVALETGLTRDEALELEEILQSRCKEGEPSGPAYRSKYAPSQRKDVYRRSIGRGGTDPTERCHLVYMVWWEQ